MLSDHSEFVQYAVPIALVAAGVALFIWSRPPNNGSHVEGWHNFIAWLSPPFGLPERIPVIEFLKIATDLDCNFVSNDSLHLLDMQDAMRQGGLDGTLTTWGKLRKWSDEQLMRREVLDKIPPEQWREFWVNLFAMRDNDNFHIRSWSPNEKSQGYMDLHVDRAEATAWLKRDAARYKGKTRPR